MIWPPPKDRVALETWLFGIVMLIFAGVMFMLAILSFWRAAT